MIIACQNCHRKHPLTDEDIAYFYPRFFCLSCGAKVPFQVQESDLQQLRASNDRNRRLTDVAGVPEEETIRRVQKGTAGADSSGG